MSSFAGRMKEYPTISLDRFDRENLHAQAYFLSHCHKDHMKGLKGPLLKRKLQFSRTVRLYCSFVTKELLLNNPKYAFWEEYTVPLELESPTQISLVDEASGEQEIVVTLLPAGHCPGSVMFLFEGCHGNVLYTGDFRLAVGDASRMEQLHSGSRVKDIQSVYLDSTFYDPRFYQIPSREVCLRGIAELIGNWISQSRYHVVWLNCKAAYGYEYLFTNLGEEFSTQVHVNSLNMFKKMPEILSYVTTDRRCQIHACRHPKDEEFLQGNRLPCGSTAADGTPLRIISIKPSTMWFGERTKKTNVVINESVCLKRAMNSDLNVFLIKSCKHFFFQIKDFLSYLQPVNILPSVVPIGRSLTEVTHMLRMMSRKRSDETMFIYKPLGVLKRSRVQRPSNNSESDNELFEGLDLVPPRKKISMNQEAEKGEFGVGVVSASRLHCSPVGLNFMDCTESNGEEEDDNEEEEGQGDTVKNKGPKWEDFFTPEVLSDSQNSQSQSCCSVRSTSPSRATGSQTPELFSEEEETPDNNKGFSLSLSASNHSSQNLDSHLDDTLILHQDQNQTSDGVTLQSEQEQLSASQTSSDFDIPSTPESKAPQTADLLHLYRKLASREEVVLREEGQGFS
uniref:Protein artemis n=1 Tax=Nothobranchius furzeri TaxID=105023 RepID=A0A8C6VZ15_NOTFU